MSQHFIPLLIACFVACCSNASEPTTSNQPKPQSPTSPLESLKWLEMEPGYQVELDDRFKFIQPGVRVVDLGAAPGGWTQVAIHRGSGIVVGVDLLPVDPIPGSILLQGDFNDPGMPTRLTDALGRKADLVLSDMAPNTTGHGATDHLRIMALAELAVVFARETLTPAGRSWRRCFRAGRNGKCSMR